MEPEIINGLFALGGALIGVIGVWIITRNNKEKRKLSLIVSPLSTLLDVGDLAKSDVKITYKNKDIKNLYAGEVGIQNTGNTSIDEIELEIQPKKGVELLDLEHSSSNFLMSDGFYSISKENKIDRIRINYLNPTDRILFTYRTTGISKPEFLLRKKGLNVETKNEIVNWIPDLYADIFFEELRKTGIPGFSLLLALINKPYKMYLESKKKNK
jgi:hypothetical protein